MEKATIYIGLFVGSVLGSWVPVALAGAGWFSGASMLGGFVGAAVGCWFGWRLTQWIDS